MQNYFASENELKDNSLSNLKSGEGLEEIANKDKSKNKKESKLGKASSAILTELRSIKEHGIKEYIFYMKPSIGKDGKTIYACKFRTMKFGSDADLDDLVKLSNGDSYGLKYVDESKLTFMGKKIRGTFLDEIPQLFYNVLWKRDMKLIGVRPMQKEYWDLLHPDSAKKLKEMNEKPGWIPLYFHSGKGTIEEKILKYSEEHKKHPVITDIKYFSNILYNYFFKGLRSSSFRKNAVIYKKT